MALCNGDGVVREWDGEEWQKLSCLGCIRCQEDMALTEIGVALAANIEKAADAFRTIGEMLERPVTKANRADHRRRRKTNNVPKGCH